MKRLICLFLMLWFPLFMGSAWAMNMQMQLEKQQVQMSQKSSMSCHKSSGKSQQNQTHKCAVCGMCALVNGAANFNTAPVLNLAFSQSPAPQFFYVAFTSQDYPPSYKPPILV
ncbi:MAG: hypothetical protein ABL880_01710 [Methylotenera sp.]